MAGQIRNSALLVRQHLQSNNGAVRGKALLRLLLCSARLLSLEGAAICEIDAALLTVSHWSEYRVWSEHFERTYVSNHCIPDLRMHRANDRHQP